MRYDDMPPALKAMMDGLLADAKPPENAAILVGDEVLKPATAKEWLQNEYNGKKVGFDRIDSMSTVSTIFMGHDHATCLDQHPGYPIYFETLIKGPYRSRIHYQTLHDARLGHQLAVAKVKQKTKWFTYAIWYGLWPVRKARIASLIRWLFPWLETPDASGGHEVGRAAVMVDKNELINALKKDG